MPKILTLVLIAMVAGPGAALAACQVPANAAQMVAEVARAMNAERARSGLPALQPLESLQSAATRQACDMAQHNMMSHTGSDGSDLGRRVRDAGACAPAAENIAAKYRTPGSVVQGWMGSRPHRANILHRRVTHFGIAVATARDGSPYWAMVLGKPCRR